MKPNPPPEPDALNTQTPQASPAGDELNLSLRLAARDGDLAATRKWLALGADPTACDSLGFTALMVAAYQGRVACVSELLPLSDRSQRSDNWGRSPLAIAAGSTASSVDCLAALLPFFDVDELDNAQRTPLMLAASEGNLASVEFLLETSDCDLASASDGRTALMAAVLNGEPCCVKAIASRCDLSARDHDGVDALEMAALNADPACVAELLRAGADPAKANASGQTAFAGAMRAGNLFCAQALLSRSDANAKDGSGKTPFMLYAENARMSAVFDADEHAAFERIAAATDWAAKTPEGNSFAEICLASRAAFLLELLSDRLTRDDIEKAALALNEADAPRVHARSRASHEAQELASIARKNAPGDRAPLPKPTRHRL